MTLQYSDDLKNIIGNILCSLEKGEETLIREYFDFEAKNNDAINITRKIITNNNYQTSIKPILIKLRQKHGSKLEKYYRDYIDTIESRTSFTNRVYNLLEKYNLHIPSCKTWFHATPEDYQYLPMTPRIKPIYYYSESHKEYLEYPEYLLPPWF